MNEPGAQDVRAAAGLCRETLEPLADGDWSIRAGDLEWSARQTLEHVAGALNSYAAHLATRASQRLPLSRAMDPDLSIGDLLANVEARAAVLAEVISAAPAATRAFHRAGMADSSHRATAWSSRPRAFCRARSWVVIGSPVIGVGTMDLPRSMTAT